MTSAEAKTIQVKLEAEVRRCGLILDSFPKNGIGLTSDEVRSTKEWIAAKVNRDLAFSKLRLFNQQNQKR